MPVNTRLSEDLKFADVIPVQVIGSDPITGSWESLSGIGRVLARAKFSETTATTATLQLYQAKDANGTGAKALGDAVTATTDATTASAPALVVEAAAGELDLAGGYGFVTAVVTYGSGSSVEATLILGDLAYRPPQ